MGIEKYQVKSFNFYCLLFTEVWDVSPPSVLSYMNVIFGKCNAIVMRGKHSSAKYVVLGMHCSLHAFFGVTQQRE